MQVLFLYFVIFISILCFVICVYIWWDLWQRNVRFVKAGWNVLRLAHQYSLLHVLDYAPTTTTTTTNQTSKDNFFRSFCNEWKRRYPDKVELTNDEDARLIEQCNNIPIEFSLYANIDNETLTRNWHKFVSDKCSKYDSKLVCLNGLTFDWPNKRVIRSLTADNNNNNNNNDNNEEGTTQTIYET